MLEVRLLGQFHISLDGEVVDIPSRPAQSLLAYLMLNRGQTHRREQLAGLFWPDSSEANARGNLRHSLWRLRQAVGEAWFESDNLVIRFEAAGSIAFDVETFESEPEAGSLEAWQASLAAYRGELLPGFYEDWVDAERERLSAKYDRRMQQLLEMLVDQRRWAAVLEWAERWISHSGVPEPAYRALMRAHHALGDAAAVAANFQRLTGALEGELGVEPSIQTRRLVEELAEQAPAEEHARLVEPAIDRVKAAGVPRESGPPAFLLVEDGQPAQSVFGRERELARLRDWLEAALDGAGQPALIVGEAGRGKSALIEAFAALAERMDPRLLIAKGVCDVYTGLDDPFLPFRQILTTLVGDVEPQWAAGAISRQQAERLWRASPDVLQAVVERGQDLVGVVVPRRSLQASLGAWESSSNATAMQVAELVASGGPAGVQAPHQSRILEECVDVLLNLASRRPVLLFLDDLHWIDPSSGALLLQLVRSIRRQPVLLVGAYRREEIRPLGEGRPHPLEEVISEVKRQYGDVWIDLDSASAEENQPLVDGLIDSQPNDLGPAFRRRLADLTGGHPLFITELLQVMQDRGDLRQDKTGRWIESDGLDWDVIPVRVEGVIQQRTGRLDPELKEAMAIASVQGERFQAQVVAEVQGVDPGGLTARFSHELERQHRLVSEVGSQRIGDRLLSEFRFRHILIQRYYYQQLGESERVFLHQATADALERSYGQESGEVAHRLARHFMEADMPARAIEYLVEAGRQALRASANQEAVDLLERALGLYVDTPGAADPQSADRLKTARMWRYAGEAYYRIGDLERSRQRLERGLEALGERSPESRNRLRLSLIGQGLLQVLHRLVPASLVRRGPARRPVLREIAYIYKMLAEVYLFANDLLPTARAALRALNTAEGAGSSPELVRAYADMAPAMPLVGLRYMGQLYRRKALETAAQVGDPLATAYAQLSTGYYLAGEAEWAAARQALEEANRFHEHAGDWNRLGIGYDLLSNVAVLQGGLVEQHEWAEKLLSLAERSGSLQHRTWALDNLARNLILAGGQRRVAEVAELAKTSLGLIVQYPAATERLTVLSLLAESHLALSDTQAALGYADEAAEVMAQSGPVSFALWGGYVGLAQVYLSLWEDEGGKASAGLTAKAEWACQQLGLFARTFPIGRPRAATLAGNLALCRGSAERARRQWQLGLRKAEQLAMPLERAYAHLQLGTSYQAGSSERFEHLTEAETIYRDLEAATGLELVRAHNEK